MNAYFDKIHPGFPIYNEAEFRTHYDDPLDPPPLLQLQCVLLAGACVCDHPTIARSRSLVKMALFRRAKALFDMHYENDRIHVVQSALVFTWHFEGADDVNANVYYWVGVACRLAVGLGLHRDLTDATRTHLQLPERYLYRRIWWTIVQMDALAALHYGRPLMINLDDCDQPPLTEQDFCDSKGDVDRKLHVDYCISNARLCLIIMSVVRLQSPGFLRRHASDPARMAAAQDSVDAQLTEWYMSRPPSLCPAAKDPDFWALQGQLHYDIALLHLHRTSQAPATAMARTQRQQNSFDICHATTLSISETVASLVDTGTLGQTWFTVLTVLLAAMIQLSAEATAAAESEAPFLAIQAQNRLRRLLPAIEATSAWWTSAESILRIFNSIHETLSLQTKLSWELGRNGRGPQTAESHEALTGAYRRVQRVYGSEEIPEMLTQQGGNQQMDVLSSDWRDMFGMGGVEALADTTLMEDWPSLPC